MHRRTLDAQFYLKDQILNWRQATELAEHRDPVWAKYSSYKEDMCFEHANIPTVKNGWLYISAHRFRVGAPDELVTCVEDNFGQITLFSAGRVRKIVARWDSGGAIGLFPEIPIDHTGERCLFVNGGGEYGGALYDQIIEESNPAIERSSYGDILREIVKKTNPEPIFFIQQARSWHHARRRQAAQELASQLAPQ